MDLKRKKRHFLLLSFFSFMNELPEIPSENGGIFAIMVIGISFRSRILVMPPMLTQDMLVVKHGVEVNAKRTNEVV